MHICTECKHTELKYCPQCDKVYCKCGKEWGGLPYLYCQPYCEPYYPTWPNPFTYDGTTTWIYPYTFPDTTTLRYPATTISHDTCDVTDTVCCTHSH